MDGHFMGPGSFMNLEIATLLKRQIIPIGNRRDATSKREMRVEIVLSNEQGHHVKEIFLGA